MSSEATVRVKGYQEFVRACDRAGKETKREVRETFRAVGEVVRADAYQKFEKYSERTAAGYRTRVRQRGVSVEQSLRKTTGKRPDFGKTQMRKALLPALEENEATVIREMENALDRVANQFERAT